MTGSSARYLFPGAEKLKPLPGKMAAVGQSRLIIPAKGLILRLGRPLLNYSCDVPVLALGAEKRSARLQFCRDYRGAALGMSSGSISGPRPDTRRSGATRPPAPVAATAAVGLRKTEA
jgi:hypothetical protein